MPAINLPSLNLSIDNSTNKETLNNILDTLQLYRKELNFLLMNLDGENMPDVIGRIKDTEGNISLIQQDADRIQLAVSDNAGNISNLQLMADSISGAVADNAGNISQLRMRASGIETAVADNAGNISQLRMRASGIETAVADNAGNISTLTQTADGLQTQVTNNKDAISTVTQTVNYIQTDVSSIDEEVGIHSSQIRQLDREIVSKVSYIDYNGEEIISLIEQTPRYIKLSAEKIDLEGITTIYSNDGRAYTTMGNRYGDFQIIHGDSIIFEIYNEIGGISISSHGDTVLSYHQALGWVGFQEVCMYRRNPRGDGTGHNITSYYESNRCYIDYGGGSRVTIRDKYGDFVGYLEIV